jgi:hypothetical protein
MTSKFGFVFMETYHSPIIILFSYLKNGLWIFFTMQFLYVFPSISLPYKKTIVFFFLETSSPNLSHNVYNFLRYLYSLSLVHLSTYHICLIIFGRTYFFNQKIFQINPLHHFRFWLTKFQVGICEHIILINIIHVSAMDTNLTCI